MREGRFVNKKEQNEHADQTDLIAEKQIDFTELSLVPLAAPFIAGPGTIAASISGTAEFGWLFMVFSLTLAIMVNFVIMLFSCRINRMLLRLHLQGPLIRLTGLIIAAVAVQMVIAGLKECMP